MGKKGRCVAIPDDLYPGLYLGEPSPEVVLHEKVLADRGVVWWEEVMRRPTALDAEQIEAIRAARSDSILHPELQAGTRYWLAALGTGELLAAWYINDTGASRFGAYIGNVDTWHRSPDPQMAAAFRIEGDAITSPAPSSLVMAGVGGLMCLGYTWRRRKSKSVAHGPSLAQ
jgi:hypothetical protein